MNRGAMNLERGSILFNQTIDQCRNIGRRGGRARARNLRARETSHLVAVPAASQAEAETARQAIERIDAQCPWLKGCEFRATSRPAQHRATTNPTVGAQGRDRATGRRQVAVSGHLAEGLA
jgi:hypothetical protein